MSKNQKKNQKKSKNQSNNDLDFLNEEIKKVAEEQKNLEEKNIDLDDQIVDCGALNDSNLYNKFMNLEDSVHTSILMATLSHGMFPNIYNKFKFTAPDRFKALLSSDNVIEIMSQFTARKEGAGEKCFNTYTLIKKKFDNGKDVSSEGFTMTHFAAANKNLRLAEYLLKQAELDVSAQYDTIYGKILPIQYCKMVGTGEYKDPIAKFLLKNGAIPSTSYTKLCNDSAKTDSKIANFLNQYLQTITVTDILYLSQDLKTIITNQSIQGNTRSNLLIAFEELFKAFNLDTYVSFVSNIISNDFPYIICINHPATICYNRPLRKLDF